MWFVCRLLPFLHFVTTDTVVVKESGTEVLTKHEKEWKDVSYKFKDQDGGSDDGDDDDDEDDDDEEESSSRKDKENGSGIGLGGAITTRRMRDKGNMCVVRHALFVRLFVRFVFLPCDCSPLACFEAFRMHLMLLCVVSYVRVCTYVFMWHLFIYLFNVFMWHLFIYLFSHYFAVLLQVTRPQQQNKKQMKTRKYRGKLPGRRRSGQSNDAQQTDHQLSKNKTKTKTCRGEVCRARSMCRHSSSSFSSRGILGVLEHTIVVMVMGKLLPLASLVHISLCASAVAALSSSPPPKQGRSIV